jgi:putative hemolysin
MTQTAEQNRVFKLDNPYSDPLRNTIVAMLEGPVERLLLFPHLNQAYADVQRMTDQRQFFDKALERLNVRYEISDSDLERLNVPSGPVILLANHPFGGLEGIILASLLRSIRCDVKFMANYLLERIPEMRELLISVDPFGRPSSHSRNVGPLRQSIRWVKGGGMLVLFPAGEVSHFDPLRGAVDPPWNRNIAKLIRMTEAPVLPLYFGGTNSMLFHAAGVVHPALRTALLPAELLNKGKKIIRLTAGRLIPHDHLKAFTSDEEMTGHLRTRTYILGQRSERPQASTPERISAAGPVPATRRRDLLSVEIERLRPDQFLAENGELAAVLARADEIPSVLFEIGRLREITFRAAGEGTGREIDLDRFDDFYEHLFIWNRKAREVVGAYRIGRTDEIVRDHGICGLYTRTLFAYKSAFLHALGPSLELGRSFVRPEYQKNYAPLLLLWKGIGRLILRDLRNRTLFGPVSISDEYQNLSRHVMVRFLQNHCLRRDLASLVKPRHPFRSRSSRLLGKRELEQALRNLDSVSDIVADIEQDGKGIPVLLKQYLKLGGSIVGFNIDPAFGNALDGLVVVDLVKTEPKVLERYLGKDGAAMFLDYHRTQDEGAA